jgi:hypothetical protein
MKTISESYFESYCKQKGIELEIIPTDQNTKTADYLLRTPEEIIVEVKQIQDNPEEKAVLSKPTGQLNDDMFRVSKAPSRIRAAIADSSSQIKNSTKGIIPSIVVIYNASSNLMCLDSEDFAQAMFGDEEYIFPENRSHFGKNKKVTKKENTTISAIGWLIHSYPEKLDLFLFHNPFAKNPLINKSSFILTNNNFVLSLTDNFYKTWVRMLTENPCS